MRPSSSSEAIARARISFSVKSLNFFCAILSWIPLSARRIAQTERISHPPENSSGSTGRPHNRQTESHFTGRMRVPMPAAIASPSEWTELAAQQRWEELREKLERTHVSDIAEMLTELPPKERAIVFRLVSRERAPEVFGYLPPNEQKELIHSLTAGEGRRLLHAVRAE